MHRQGAVHLLQHQQWKQGLHSLLLRTCCLRLPTAAAAFVSEHRQRSKAGPLPGLALLLHTWGAPLQLQHLAACFHQQGVGVQEFLQPRACSFNNMGQQPDLLLCCQVFLSNHHALSIPLYCLHSTAKHNLHVA